MTEHSKHNAPHIMGYGTLAAVWGGLMLLTVITVTVSRVDLGFLNVVAAMGVASLKALLVIFLFMHLRYENRAIKGMVFLAFLMLAIAIGFTFFDVGYR